MSEFAAQSLEIQHEHRRKTLLEHLAGPLGSLLFHVLIAFIAIRMMVFPAPPEKATESPITVKIPNVVDPDPPSPEPDLPSDPPPTADAVLLTDRQVDIPITSGADPLPGGTADPGVPSEVVSLDLPGLNVACDSIGRLVMKDLYAGRSERGRSSARDRFGGDARTETAVSNALEWLRLNQAANGTWGAQNQVGITGLALLTFLAHGETTGSPRHGAAVEKAIRYLVGQQGEDGCIGKAFSQAGVYAHAVATYALSEAYSLTRIPSLKPVVEKAAAVIIGGQQAGGGWDYAYAKGARVDTSVAGWQIQALKAAFIAGAEIDGIKEALSKAAVYLKSMQNPETGQIGYGSPGAGNPPITAVGVLCLELTGHAGDKETEKGLSFMRGWDLNWDKPGFAAPLYGWYYITQAKFHKGGADWQSWNRDLKRELPGHQKPDGHWEFAAEEHGSGSGFAYSTCLAALSLEIYYKSLPTYLPIVVDKKVEEKAADVTIEII